MNRQEALYDVNFDPIKGLMNSLEYTSYDGGNTRYNYFIETTRNLSDWDQWITAVYKDGRYITLGKIHDVTGKMAKKMHWRILRKIKSNGYKLDGLFKNKS